MPAPEWLDTALHIGEPLAGGLIAWLGVALRYRRKIRSLESTLDTLRRALEGYKLALEQAFHAARNAAIEGDKVTILQFEQRLRDVSSGFEEKLRQLRGDLQELEDGHMDQTRSSAHDHATAAALARDMVEVREQCAETLALLNEIRGYMMAQGAKL